MVCQTVLETDILAAIWGNWCYRLFLKLTFQLLFKANNRTESLQLTFQQLFKVDNMTESLQLTFQQLLKANNMTESLSKISLAIKVKYGK